MWCDVIKQNDLELARIEFVFDCSEQHFKKLYLKNRVVNFDGVYSRI